MTARPVDAPANLSGGAPDDVTHERPAGAATGDRARSYWPGVDGLRAVSVLAVLAYHLGAPWATGGYLGVETFFVVSGFLITFLLLDEHRRTGRIAPVAFWLRRARRLLPAVVVLIAAVLAWSAVVLPDGDLHRFRSDAVASLLYVQNWHAIVAEQPYFVAFDRASPLRHLWSLAIEEQFYLLWPLVLPALLRRVGPRRAGQWILAAAVASVLLMTATADVAAPERAYYGTDTRLFGLLAGCLLAWVWRPHRARRDVGATARRTVEWAGVIAAVVLVRQFVVRSEYDPWTFPWGFLVVDLATAVVIVAVTHPASRLVRILGAGAPAALGRRSYSIYLWHWPVIVCTRPGIDWGLTGATALVVRLALIAVLSELSYRYVEQPFRDGRARAWWERTVRAPVPVDDPATAPTAPTAPTGPARFLTVEERRAAARARLGTSPDRHRDAGPFGGARVALVAGGLAVLALVAVVAAAPAPSGSATAGLSLDGGQRQVSSDGGTAGGSEPAGTAPASVAASAASPPSSGQDAAASTTATGPAPDTTPPPSSSSPSAPGSPGEPAPAPGAVTAPGSPPAGDQQVRPDPADQPVPGVTIIGESVTLGGARALQDYYGERVQIDAIEGRSFTNGVELIEGLAAHGRLTPTVIAHLGTNGVAPAGALDRILAAVGPSRTLVLVNVRVPQRWEQQVNDEVGRFVAEHPEVQLANWWQLTHDEAGLLTPDGVHLTRTGQVRYRDLLIARAP